MQEVGGGPRRWSLGCQVPAAQARQAVGSSRKARPVVRPLATPVWCGCVDASDDGLVREGYW